MMLCIELLKVLPNEKPWGIEPQDVLKYKMLESKQMVGIIWVDKLKLVLFPCMCSQFPKWTHQAQTLGGLRASRWIYIHTSLIHLKYTSYMKGISGVDHLRNRLYVSKLYTMNDDIFILLYLRRNYGEHADPLQDEF